jgi:hypothetical protein
VLGSAGSGGFTVVDGMLYQPTARQPYARRYGNGLPRIYLQNIGVNVSAPAAPTALNDTAANAANVAMAKAVSSTITIPITSAGYYFYPLDTGETR